MYICNIDALQSWIQKHCFSQSHEHNDLYSLDSNIVEFELKKHLGLLTWCKVTDIIELFPDNPYKNNNSPMGIWFSNKQINKTNINKINRTEKNTCSYEFC